METAKLGGGCFIGLAAVVSVLQLPVINRLAYCISGSLPTLLSLYGCQKVGVWVLVQIRQTDPQRKAMACVWVLGM